MMLATHEQQENKMRESIYSELMRATNGKRNDNVFAAILSSYFAGEGSMPFILGLDKKSFSDLMRYHYPGFEFIKYARTDLEDADAGRIDEQDDLHTLLIKNKRDEDTDVEWMAGIVIAGCMGGNHLWQDLGLWSRDMLTGLMEFYFPKLALQNNKNMKWKKFLYKQLCNQEGIYTCRSPSCEVCVDYKECFAPE